MLSYKYQYQYIDYKSTINRYQWIDENLQRIYYMRGDCFSEYTNKEWDFFKRYGFQNLGIWLEMSSNERSNLEETIKAYQIFWSLYYEHYEDLDLYAIMYRNIPLFPTMDIMSVRFFVSKVNEIRNFKEKIMTLDTNKAKVVRLYYYNRTIFTKILSRYILGGEVYTVLGREKNSLYEMPSYSKKSLYEKFFYGSYGVGIDNLTKTDCERILDNKDELTAEYKRIYRETIEEYVVSEKGHKFSERFFQERFVVYCGRIGWKISDSKKSLLLDETKELPLMPPAHHLYSEHRDYVLTKHEYDIVNKLCREVEERKEHKRKEEAEIRQREWEKKRLEEETRRAKFEFNKRNKHYRDSNISFDESTHLYKVDGVTLQSVTNFVKGCFPEFDAEFHAKRQSERTGKSVEEILKIWADKGDETRILGTTLHKRIENYYQDISFSNADDKAFSLFKQFADRITLEPYRTEWAVYDEKYNIAGTIDFVDYQNGEYIIYDWKRSDKIIDNEIPIKYSKYGEKGKYPLEHLDNTPYYHYALQLSLYKFILENNYDIKISDLRLGVFYPTYNKPYVLRMPYLEKEINDIFSLRSEILF